jgi:hypothetical protein
VRLVITFLPEENIYFPEVSTAVSAWFAEHGSGDFIGDEKKLFAKSGWEITLAHNDLLTALHALRQALERFAISFEVRCG